MNSREDHIYFARLAEQGERYEDMIRYMKEVSRVNLLSSFISKEIIDSSIMDFPNL